MVPLRSQPHKFLILFQHLLVGKRNAVHALQTFVLSFTEPIGTGVLCDAEVVKRVNRVCSGQRYRASGRAAVESHTLVMANALIRPVDTTCGPRQRSISGPQRYAETFSLSGILLTI